MISIIGSVLGFATSVGPGMFNKWMESKAQARDQEHERLMQQQLSADRRDEAIISGIGEANIAVQKTAQTEMRNASRWTVNYAASVRPTITYMVFLLFILIHLAVFMGWINDDQYTVLLASGALESIVSVIISFYFGQRLSQKMNP